MEFIDEHTCSVTPTTPLPASYAFWRARCASRHPQALPRAITPEFSRARRTDRKLATRLDVLAHPAVRRELRKLYDAAIYVGSRTPVRRPAPRDCEYRMHVRRGDVRRGGRRPVLCGDSLPSTRRRPRNCGGYRIEMVWMA